MKLLLDVHHSPRAAERLRRHGHDVIAAADDPRLAARADENLLRFAAADGRAAYPENLDAALDRFLIEPPPSGEDWVYWLS